MGGGLVFGFIYLGVKFTIHDGLLKWVANNLHHIPVSAAPFGIVAGVISRGTMRRKGSIGTSIARSGTNVWGWPPYVLGGDVDFQCLAGRGYPRLYFGVGTRNGCLLRGQAALGRGGERKYKGVFEVPSNAALETQESMSLPLD